MICDQKRKHVSLIWKGIIKNINNKIIRIVIHDKLENIEGKVSNPLMRTTILLEKNKI